MGRAARLEHSRNAVAALAGARAGEAMSAAAAKLFRLVVNNKRWTDFEDQWAAEREAARLRSLGWKAHVCDRRVPAPRQWAQPGLFSTACYGATRAAQHLDASTPTHEGHDMKASKFYAPEPIKLETFDDTVKEITGTITAAVSRRFDDRERIVLTLNDDEYSVIVNDTAYRVLKKGYGDDTDNWIGLPLTVYKGTVRYNGNEQDGICVRIPEGEGKPATTARIAPPADDGDVLSDDIPF
jgi:hypothetical protein